MIDENRQKKRSLYLINEHFELVANLTASRSRDINWLYNELLDEIKKPESDW